MATVTIRDEATRGVLLRAVWNVAVEAIGGVGSWDGDGMYVDIDDSDAQFKEAIDCVAKRLDAHADAIRLMGEFERASLGEVVYLDGKTVKSVEAQYALLRESPGILTGASKPDRDRILGLYGAAEALVAELEPEAVA